MTRSGAMMLRNTRGGRRCPSGARGGWAALADCLARTAPLLVALAVAAATPRPALADSTEQAVKAALIFNLTRFVDWPAATFSSPATPFVVAIMGQDDVGDALEQALLNKSVDGRRLELRRVKTAEDASKSQLLYVAASERRHVDAILAGLRGSTTLSVSAIEHFATRGGSIALVLEEQQVHLEVNLASTRGSHLTVSSRLLSVARIVGETP